MPERNRIEQAEPGASGQEVLPEKSLTSADSRRQNDDGQGLAVPSDLPDLENTFEVLEALPQAILVTCPTGEVIFCNSASERLFGASSDSLTGTYWSQHIDPRDRTSAESCAKAATDTNDIVSFEARVVRRTCELAWTKWTLAPLMLETNYRGEIHTLEDISARRAAEEKLSATMTTLSKECERARVTLECIGDAVISTDDQGRVSYMNKVAENLTGWPRERAHGLPFSQVFTVIDSTSREPAENPAIKAVEADGIVQLASNCSLLRLDGTELEIEDSAAPILDAAGQPAGAVVIFRDRKFSQASTMKMSYLARHDALTGVANRVALVDQFEQAINLARRHGSQLAVLFIDLDHFKEINDHYGHKAGDRLLISVAREMTGCVRNTDTVCRYGGDEFVIVLNEIDKPEDAAKVARKVHKAIRNCLIEEYARAIDLSIGISIYPGDGADIDTLLRNADAAMYSAKSTDGQSHSFYLPGMLRGFPSDPIKRKPNVP